MPPKRDKDKAAKEKAEKEPVEKEQAEREKAEKEPAEQEKKSAGAKQKARLGKMVTIQSRISEPLTFSAPGFECRVSPFGRVEVPETALVVGQLQRLISQGSVIVRGAPPAAGTAERKAQTEPDDKSEKKSDKKSERDSETGEERKVADRRAPGEGDLWPTEPDEGD